MWIPNVRCGVSIIVCWNSSGLLQGVGWIANVVEWLVSFPCLVAVRDRKLHLCIANESPEAW